MVLSKQEMQSQKKKDIQERMNTKRDQQFFQTLQDIYFYRVLFVFVKNE